MTCITLISFLGWSNDITEVFYCCCLHFQCIQFIVFNKGLVNQKFPMKSIILVMSRAEGKPLWNPAKYVYNFMARRRRRFFCILEWYSGGWGPQEVFKDFIQIPHPLFFRIFLRRGGISSVIPWYQKGTSHQISFLNLDIIEW